MKCNICKSKKGKRLCLFLKTEICSECCGQRKERNFCPPACSYFNQQISPGVLFSQGKFGSPDTGEEFPLPGDIYVPYIFRAIGYKITTLEISAIDSNTLKMAFSGQLLERYPEILDQLYLKEEWKKDIINPSLKGEVIAPFMSVIMDDGYIVYPDEILMKNNSNSEIPTYIDPSVCFFILPESFPRFAPRKMKENEQFVLFFGRHNIVFTDPKLLKEPFTIDITVHNYHKNYIDGKFNWTLPVIFPFGAIRIEGVKHNENANLKFEDTNTLRQLSPRISKDIWGLERFTCFPLPKEVQTSRLEYGKESSKVTISSLKEGELVIDKIHSLLFDLKYQPVTELTVSVKFGKNPIPLSLYEHLNRITALSIPLAATFITNTSDNPQTLIVTAEIEGVTNPETNTITIGPKEQQVITHTPHILPGKTHPPETCQTSFKINISRVTEYASSLIFSKTANVRLLAKDTMIWQAVLPNGVSQNVAQYIACWVTPHVPEIDAIVAKAVKRHPKRVFSGYQSKDQNAVREQVKAIFDELSSIPLRYISRTISYGSNNGQSIQRVLSPKNTLNSHGNCIDLTVLMASILENIEITPLIVFVPGHAFLGWETLPEIESYEFLECTLIGSASFEQACEAGQKAHDKEFGPGGGHRTQIVNIRKMRVKGIYPMLLD